MRRNRTSERNGVEAPRTIDPIQLAILKSLLAGRTVTKATDGVGISRTTVHRWLKDDFFFRAEVNVARYALRQSSLARLDALCERSIEVLRQALNQSNNTRIALEVLKGCRVLGGDPFIEPNAELLESESRFDTIERLARIREQSLFF